MIVNKGNLKIFNKYLSDESMKLISWLDNEEIKNCILSINNFKNNDDTIYLLEIDDFINYNDLEIKKVASLWATFFLHHFV